MAALIGNLFHKIIADTYQPSLEFITSYESNLEKPTNFRGESYEF